MDYTFTNKSTSLTHIGVLGMKWGKYRAKRAAISAGRSSATAKIVEKEAGKTASIYSEKAKLADGAAKMLAKKGSIAGSIANSAYADANKKRATETIDAGKDYADYYKQVSKTKTEKAYKLAEKYGGAETRKKVDALIKEHSKKPYDVEFDATDPVVSAIKKSLAG